jgi:hypothetical protein
LLKTAARQPRGREWKLGEAPADAAVEPAEAELRRHHHQPEQQRERRHVDGATGVGERRRARREQRDRAEQGDAGAVQGQAREAPEQHAEVHRSEDGEDHAGHRANG